MIICVKETSPATPKALIRMGSGVNRNPVQFEAILSNDKTCSSFGLQPSTEEMPCILPLYSTQNHDKRHSGIRLYQLLIYPQWRHSHDFPFTLVFQRGNTFFVPNIGSLTIDLHFGQMGLVEESFLDGFSNSWFNGSFPLSCFKIF